MQSQPDRYATVSTDRDNPVGTRADTENAPAITVVDCGIGNLGSINNIFRKIGYPVTVSGRTEDILAADKLILPGVGHFDEGMKRIQNSGLLPSLSHRVLEGHIPILGICLGMQLLFESSDEGHRPGLGWIPGRCERFAPDLGVKVPHMGWNIVKHTNNCALFDGLGEDARFYFAHSFHARCATPDHVVATSEYGLKFSAVVQCRNVLGVQFHPEKSHRFGMTLLANFARL